MKINSRYYLLWMVISLASFGMLGGCMKNRANKRAAAIEENTLRLNLVAGEPPSFDPHELVLSTRGCTLGKWLFEGLTRLNTDGEYELAGAEKVEISPCKTRYLFTLRPNFYADGSAVLAYDYERSWKKALLPDAKCPKAHLFYCIKNAEKAKKKELPIDDVGVKALDDKTLLVELAHPISYLFSLLSSPIFAPFKTEDKTILFNGPYTIGKWEKNNYLELELNPFFWDHAEMQIKKVKIFMVQDSVTAFSLYEKGEIDWIGDPFSWLPSDIVFSEISKGRFFKGEAVTFPFWMYLNTEHLPLSSPSIRRALSAVIDRQQIAEHISIGDDPIFTPLPNNAIFAESPTTNNDLAKGQELFEAGLKELNMTKENFPVLKLSSCSLLGHKKIAEYLQHQWQEAFGIQVDLDIQEWNTFYSNLAKGKYQIGGHFILSDYDSPLACLEMLSSDKNFSKWQQAQYQKVIEELRKTPSSTLQAPFLKEAQEILQKEMPIIWLINRSQYRAYSANLKGLCFDQKGTPDLRWAYLEQSK